jgi:hypothetical protein
MSFSGAIRPAKVRIGLLIHGCAISSVQRRHKLTVHF